VSLKYLILCLVLLIICVGGCGENSSGGGDQPLALSLQVTDLDGNPLAEVNFHYIFYVGYDVVIRNTSIEFALPTTDTVTLRIYDPFKRLITTLIDHRRLPAGMHMILYGADTLTNGIYEYRLIRPDTATTGKFMVRTDDPALLKSLPALAQTNQKGNLTLNYSTLGIGEKFTLTGNTVVPIQMTVSDSITILLFKQGYEDYSAGLKLNTVTTTEKTIALSPTDVIFP
jgi:hypothetical protein